VINFDYPNCSEDYVHRIGRTGRHDKKGTAYTFFTTSNGKQANELIDVLREANQTVNPKLFELADMSRHMSGANKRRRYGTGGGHWNNQMNGGFKRKYDGGHSNGSAPKRTHYESGNTINRYDSVPSYYNSSQQSKPSVPSYINSQSNQNLAQNRYNSFAH